MKQEKNNKRKSIIIIGVAVVAVLALIGGVVVIGSGGGGSNSEASEVVVDERLNDDGHVDDHEHDAEGNDIKPDGSEVDVVDTGDGSVEADVETALPSDISGAPDNEAGDTGNSGENAGDNEAKNNRNDRELPANGGETGLEATKKALKIEEETSFGVTYGVIEEENLPEDVLEDKPPVLTDEETTIHGVDYDPFSERNWFLIAYGLNENGCNTLKDFKKVIDNSDVDKSGGKIRSVGCALWGLDRAYESENSADDCNDYLVNEDVAIGSRVAHYLTHPIETLPCFVWNYTKREVLEANCRNIPVCKETQVNPLPF